ncbi:glycosyltransferase family 2 protein [Treponema socranskii]|uniref:glycosyltransferase family 2 protein n=1 Tax=Treponema socranskii TaxID=53419 RepID=UPI002872823A|nr:glycosyltransferase family A protein [Treponema socranskii]MDR9859126.1 glycosyltransferase family A protein [Treponema socranskii]
MRYAPIIIPTLNRYAHFQRCIESLKENSEAIESEIFIGLDFPLTKDHEYGYKKICAYLQTLNGFKSIHIIKRTYNIGAINNIKNLIAVVCNSYDRFIFTEDDNIFSPYFLEYINKGLNIFENDKTIESISGFSYPIKMPKSNTTVIKMQRYFSDWGFGTWKNRYYEAVSVLTNSFFQNLFRDKQRLKLLRTKSKKNFIRAFALMHDPNCRPYDYTNSIGQILLNRYSIMPKETLVKNTGWDNTGIHCAANSALAQLFIDQKLNVTTRISDFIFDDKESTKINKSIEKSPIGDYDRFTYYKVLIKSWMYRHDIGNIR